MQAQAVDELTAGAHAILERHGGPVEATFEEILMGYPPAEHRLYFDLDNDSYVEGTPAEQRYPGS